MHGDPDEEHESPLLLTESLTEVRSNLASHKVIEQAQTY